jgi:hypothetical protein
MDSKRLQFKQELQEQVKQFQNKQNQLRLKEDDQAVYEEQFELLQN